MNRVVFLVNFLAPDLLAVCRYWKTQVGRLDVLASVAMEGNRKWQPKHDDINVVVQRTWTISRREKHPAGYVDVNYFHFPLDTYRQLRKHKPHVVVSVELGMRTAFAALYRALRPNMRLVIAVCTSEHIEKSRDRWYRRVQRMWLLKRADAVTHNSESCRRYLLKLGVPATRLHPWNYAADPAKIHTGQLLASGNPQEKLSLLTIGQLIARKGVEIAARQLTAWALNHPERSIEWTLVGSGPSEPFLRSLTPPSNLQICLRGNYDADQLRAAYQIHECLLFPTLGDEWGLVVDEAMSSGLAVIGSTKAESCQTLIQDGINGYLYDPANAESLEAKLTAWATLSVTQRAEMRSAARRSTLDRTPEVAGAQIARLVNALSSDLLIKG